MSVGFDWQTFVTSVSSAVLVALLVDWGKQSVKRMLGHLRSVLARGWGRIRAYPFPKAQVLCAVLAVLIVVLLWLLKPYDVPVSVQNVNSTVPWWLNP
jgi:hypothetical protein